ncbi:hypothetical protein ApDm4_0824 [Acetobacter pomorum]|nr:hypothetical protein ApDm4_0824 [Acetobacter pomorum]
MPLPAPTPEGKQHESTSNSHHPLAFMHPMRNRHFPTAL